MAAAAGTNKPQRHRHLPRYVPLCRLLLVAALLTGGIIGAGECSPPAARVFLLRTQDTEQLLQGLRGSSDHGEPAAGDGSPPAAVAGGRRMLIGSRPPTCTYNECRGCRHRCSVQEVPIDASDPINSAYHYKCICHL
ncbi:hypothetical protein PVAP13_6NG307400 [Panicum virgatum]|uniref:Stomagen C-terminal domain-containing protein n=1 Tax=Panicum virgatum TaxID=38727 RepID=A0A8T0R571_PANVG|nr:hypothetical protein PVAP13_6NG307400 [Panicum virgatum]